MKPASISDAGFDLLMLATFFFRHAALDPASSHGASAP
jgi:hypothetical protein